MSRSRGHGRQKDTEHAKGLHDARFAVVRKCDVPLSKPSDVFLLSIDLVDLNGYEIAYYGIVGQFGSAQWCSHLHPWRVPFW